MNDSLCQQPPVRAAGRIWVERMPREHRGVLRRTSRQSLATHSPASSGDYPAPCGCLAQLAWWDRSKATRKSDLRGISISIVRISSHSVRECVSVTRVAKLSAASESYARLIRPGFRAEPNALRTDFCVSQCITNSALPTQNGIGR